MLAAIFAFALQGSPVERPVLPVGCSPVVSHLANRIAELTEKGDFSGAKSAANLLPHRKVNIEWDDSGAPEKVRYDYTRVRDQVLFDWHRFATVASYEVVKTGGDIKVIFAEGSGVKLEWSEDPKAPRLTAKIGLAEGKGSLDPATLNNEFSFAVGSYLGVAKLPLPGHVMAGAEITPPAPLRPNPFESSIANQTVLVSEQIKALADRSQVMKSGLPTVGSKFEAVNLGKVYQGDVPKQEFEVKNSGTARLAFKIIPDCNCFSTTAMRVAAPDETLTIEAQMATDLFWGTVHKTLYLFSNDADNPVTEIPVTVNIKPRYRILPPTQTYVAGDKGVTVEAFLFAPDDRPIKITSAESQGLPGEVKVERWSGMLADPDMGEGELERKGYKLKIHIPDVPDGSQFGTNIVIATDDPNFSAINYPIHVQKGIVVSPLNVYLGEVGAASRTVALTVSRPGQPFEITRIESDSEHISASFTRLGESADGYRLAVVFDGKAAKGDYRANLTIVTNDPKQPKLIIPVSATVVGQ